MKAELTTVALACALAMALPAPSAFAAPQDKSTTEKVEDGAKKAAEATKEGAEKVASKTKQGLSKTGEVITDAWITGRVNMRFVGEDLLKGSSIDVDTKDNVVTLNGTVASTAARAKAVQIARGTEGVHRVVNHLTVGFKH